MKKTILSIATVLLIGLSSFAADKNDGVNKLAVQSFHREFSKASNISWEQKANIVKVTFTMNNQVLFAYYNNNGDLQAIVRNLSTEQLPVNLLADLKGQWADYWISDLFELSSDDQTSYYVTLENADKTIVLTSCESTGWTVYSKTRKDVQK